MGDSWFKHFTFRVSRAYKALMFDLCASRHPLYIARLRFFFRPKPQSLAWWLDQYSKLIPKLTVVQVGANDGFNHDPIVRFIKRDRWKGVLLEPQPHVHDRFLKRLHKDNPDLHTLNAALDYEDGSRDMYHIAFSQERWATGLSTFSLASLEHAIASGHVGRSAAKQGIALPAKPEDYIVASPVKCISAKTLLRDFDIQHIDLLQIDAEGFDWEVIQMMDIPKTRPGAIVFEVGHLSAEQLKTCHDMLKEHDYRIIPCLADHVAMQNRHFKRIMAQQ